jgi:hypothetical protein
MRNSATNVLCNVLRNSLSPSDAESGAVDADLAEVMNEWSCLSQAVRKVILKMIREAQWGLFCGVASGKHILS